MNNIKTRTYNLDCRNVNSDKLLVIKAIKRVNIPIRKEESPCDSSEMKKKIQVTDPVEYMVIIAVRGVK